MDNLEILWEKIHLLYDRQRFREAIEACHELLSFDPQSEVALYMAGLCALQLKDQQTADEMAAALVDANPESPLGHDLLAYNAHNRKDYDKAEHHYREAIRLDPDEPHRYAAMGYFLARRNRIEEGITVVRNGLKIDPHNVTVLTTLQQLYLENDEPEIAEEMERAAADIDPDEADFHLYAGIRLLGAGRGAEARGRFLESLRLQPGETDNQLIIAHERVRKHPFFKSGWFLSTRPDMLIVALLTPVFWYGLSWLFRPFIYLAWISLAVVVGAYAYRGLFFLCRSIVLRRIRRGRL